MVERVSAAKNVVEALAAWARDEGSRVGERAGENVSAVLRELGFVTHSEHEDLELRVAQLEHRIHLLEDALRERARLEPAPPPVTLEGDGAAGDAEPGPPL